MLVTGHFKLALELEQEELRGAQTREGRGKSGGTRGGLGRERKWEYHASVSGAPGRVPYVHDVVSLGCRGLKRVIELASQSRSEIARNKSRRGTGQRSGRRFRCARPSWEAKTMMNGGDGEESHEEGGAKTLELLRL